MAAGLVSATLLATGSYEWMHTSRVLPLVSDISLPAEVRVLAARVSPGATMSSLLHAHGLAEREIVELGTLDPEAVVTPGIFVQRVVRVPRVKTGAGGARAA